MRTTTTTTTTARTTTTTNSTTSFATTTTGLYVFAVLDFPEIGSLADNFSPNNNSNYNTTTHF
jgi:hypothetical protein